MGGLAAALEAAHQDDGRGLGGELDPGVLPAHQGGQLLVDDLDDLLGRGQALEHFLPDRPFRDGLYKVLDDLVVDVRFQQRQFDLPHRLFDIRLVQFPFGPQPLKGGGKLIGQAFKRQAVPLLYSSVK